VRSIDAFFALLQDLLSPEFLEWSASDDNNRLKKQPADGRMKTVEALMVQPAVLKLSLGDRTHRVTVDLAALTFDALVAHVKETMGDALPAQWSLEYTDDEGDRVTLAHARELGEALDVLLDATGGANTVAFRVTPRSVPLSQRVLPLLKKVGQLSASVARVASERTLQLRNSDVVSRGRASLTSSATRTGSLLRSAGRGVASGLHHAHSAVSVRLERRRSRSSSASSSPSGSSPSFSANGDKYSDAVLSPMASEGVETVDLRASISSSEPETSEASAQHQEEEEEEEEEEEAPPLVPVESVEDDRSESAEEQTEEAAYESDADTLATTSCDEEDREWDLVAAPSAAGAMPLIAEDSWTR
jgi:hypothetical protein